MAALLYRLGRFAARRRWTVLIAWVVLLGIAGAGYAIGGGRASSGFDIPGTPTQKVTDELADRLSSLSGGTGSVVFSTSDGGAFSAEQQAEISDLIASADDLSGVRHVVDPFQTEAQRTAQQQKLSDGQRQLTAGLAKLDAGQQQLDAGQQQLDAGRAQLDAARAQAEAAGAAGQAAIAQLDAQQAQLDAQQATLDAQQQKITDGRAEAAKSQRQIDEGGRLLELASGIRQVAADDSAAVATVQFTKSRMELSQSVKDGVVDHFESKRIDGVRIDLSTEIAQGVPKILGPGEVVGVIVAAVVLLVMLGTLLAAALPIVTAIVGVGVGVLTSLAFSGVVEMSSVTPVLGVMLGLAVGIDYALFIVNRHRRQLAQGMEVHESIGLAVGTAGNAVVFAGTTVLVALLALNITGIPFLGLMGTVGAVCVAVAVLVAITAAPALLSLIGLRALSRRARARLAAQEERQHSTPKPMATWRAIITVLVGAAALLTVAIPAGSMRLGLPDGSSEPVDSSQYRAYQVMKERFGTGSNGPLLVTVTTDRRISDDDEVEAQLAIAERLSSVEDVDAVAPIAVADDRELLAFQVLPKSGPLDVETETLVRHLRALDLSGADTTSGASTAVVDALADSKVGVAGQAAGNIDVSQKLQDVLPLYVGVVVGLSLLIMIVVFRSLLVPLIATGGFILSLLATYGALTAVFQWGWLSPVFGVHDPGPLLNFLPVILVGILFGLAMDYQLFLVSGMREAHAHGMAARSAVTWGVRAGRAVVTAAGIIMISVFGGFIFSEAALIRPIGFGLAVGVLLDAFVVRMLLVPALMHLLGRGAWWLPRWLGRILPDVDIEGAALERSHGIGAGSTPAEPVDAALSR